MSWPHFIEHPFPPYTTNSPSWAPAADIRESATSFVIEIEVPGLRQGNEDKVLVQWMSPKTLIVSADTQRAALPEPITISATSSKLNADSDHAHNTRESVPSDTEAGAPLERTQSHSEDAQGSGNPAAKAKDPARDKFLIRERHVGYWRRSFTLPEDADFNIDPNVAGRGRLPEYKIDAGVLLIEVYKAKV